MSQEEYDIELIEKYLKEELSDGELSNFNQRLQQEEGFADKVVEYKSIIEGLARSVQVTEIKNELTVWEKEIQSEAGIVSLSSSVTPWKRYLAIAAAVSLLLVTAWYVFIPYKKANAQQLFAAYFVPYEDVISVRGNEHQLALDRAFDFYNKADYTHAIQSFKSYLSQNPDDAEALFYKAVSELASGNNEQAIVSFNNMLRRESIFKEQAAWYRALAYLNKNDVKTCKKYLDEITSQQGHDYQAKARELAEKLN